MTCPNCGLSNADGAKFCANCGTTLASTGYQQQPTPYPQPPAYQPSAYQPAAAGGTSNSLIKNIGIGCLIVLAIFIFMGLSCTRACLGLRHRSYIQRRY